MVIRSMDFLSLEQVKLWRYRFPVLILASRYIRSSGTILARVGLAEEPGGREKVSNYDYAAEDVSINMARTDAVDH